MIAADDDRRFELAACHQFVEAQSRFCAVAESKPADARGQTLERNTLLRHCNPASQRRILRKEFEQLVVTALDVRRIAGERGKAERPAAFAKQRTNERGHKAGKIKRVLYAGALRHRAN